MWGVYTEALAALGFVVLFLFILDSAWSLIQLCRALLAPLFLPNEETSLIKKYGSWALITGCTDGIGRAYAFELAKRGINIILVSRNAEKLNNTAKEIESKHSVKTKVIVADFSLGPKAVNSVKEQIGILPVNILVNNVGKQYEYPMYLTEVPEKELTDIININVSTVTHMCRAFIDDMRKSGRGAIINVSSGSELQPLPLMTVYAATKIKWFGEEKIFCIIALNERDQSEGATANITAGGVNHTFVNIYLQAQTGKPLIYNIQIYGKNSSRIH